MSMNSDRSDTEIPQEQYEHIRKAMRHLGRVDDRDVPNDVARFLDDVYGELDSLYARVEE